MDHHVPRKLVYWDKTSQSHLWSIRGAVAYRIVGNLQIEGSLRYQLYTMGKGPMVVLDQTTGKKTTFAGNSSGMRNQMLTIAVALRYAI